MSAGEGCVPTFDAESKPKFSVFWGRGWGRNSVPTFDAESKTSKNPNSLCLLGWGRGREGGRGSVADPGFPRGEGANPKGGRQLIIYLIFPENCMKMKKCWARGGRVPRAPP